MNPEFLHRLQASLPEDTVLVGEEACRVYECDGLSAYRQIPDIVAVPHEAEQLSRIVRLCHEYEVSMVPRGAGTGLSGGALPQAGSILISLARFNRIIEINPHQRIARVQPGVRNLAISEAARPFNLFYAPDPSSQIACSIGGNVAENSGGVHCLKYGLTIHNVIGLRIMLSDGEELVLDDTSLDGYGYDLLALMHGSEGLLAFVTEVTVQLLPMPERVVVVMAAFDSVVSAGQAVADIVASGVIPAGLELMDNASIRASEDYAAAGYPRDAAALLLCEIDGEGREVDEYVKVVGSCLESSNARSIRLAEDEVDRARLWAGRKAAFPAVGRISPDYYCMDGTIPRHALPEVLEGIQCLSDEYGLRVANVFHAGDGNLHPLILYDANIPGELQKTEEMGGRILELCLGVGGSITGEHGVGVEKLDQMCLQFNQDELCQFHALKEAFDPQGLLNPGKAVPSLHRCAEFGAMHVHAGNLPFPDIPRF
ncbi:MAG: FAD-binding protein [Gammaproteobacteria bacterium]|nr:MAG: FAD-binding protein [Gammaproteobacteria bacterium]